MLGKGMRTELHIAGGFGWLVNPNGLQFPLLKFGVPPGVDADVGASLWGKSGAY